MPAKIVDNIGHGVLAATITAVACAIATRTRKVKIMALAWLIFHVHLALDLLSGKGPDDYIWGLRYFFPLSETNLSWSGQWYLHDWKNSAIGAILIIALCYFARKRGRTPVEILSPHLDERVRASFSSVFKRKPE